MYTYTTSYHDYITDQLPIYIIYQLPYVRLIIYPIISYQVPYYYIILFIYRD